MLRFFSPETWSMDLRCTCSIVYTCSTACCIASFVIKFLIDRIYAKSWITIMLLCLTVVFLTFLQTLFGCWPGFQPINNRRYLVKFFQFINDYLFKIHNYFIVYGTSYVGRVWGGRELMKKMNFNPCHRSFTFCF